MSATNEQFSFNFIVLANKLNSFSSDLIGLVFFYMFVAAAVFSKELYAPPSRLRTSTSFSIETYFVIMNEKRINYFLIFFFSYFVFRRNIMREKNTTLLTINAFIDRLAMTRYQTYLKWNKQKKRMKNKQFYNIIWSDWNEWKTNSVFFFCEYEKSVNTSMFSFSFCWFALN